jgi:acyl carrier protein
MDNNAFYSKLAELMELSDGAISGSSVLADIPEWDSVAVISFIAMADSDYSATVPPERIARCRTVDDLAGLVAEFSPQHAE